MITDLMPHQAQAVDKLHRLRVGALFMEMGTGKSRTAIELAVRRRAAGKIERVVWFCPVSLKITIAREILKHTGEVAYVFGPRTQEGKMPSAFWYVIGIESMSSSPRVICAAAELAGAGTMALVDESGYIKGPRASRTKWITEIGWRCRYRMILTGTPISQGVVDLYAQMRFLDEKVLGYRSFYSFANNHLEYHKDYPGLITRSLNTDWLAAKIAPYVYQVKKEECLTLPEKLYSRRWFAMSPDQRTAYERAKEEILEDVLDDDPRVSQLAIFKLFGALQQIISGFWNRRDEETEMRHTVEFRNKRMEMLLAVLEEIPTDEKVIVWAKFRHDIRAVKAALGEDCVQFYGDQSPVERQASVDAWRTGPRVFVATQDTGGHGLTLNESAYVVFYNNQFKYSSRLQAEDRNHRIGQGRPVTYIDLICSDSIDERIIQAIDRKGNAVESFAKEVQRMRDKKTVKQAIKAL